MPRGSLTPAACIPHDHHRQGTLYMNSSDQETIILTTNDSQYSIAPGGSLKLPVIITNQGRTQDRLRVGVEGIPVFWVSTEHQIVLLQPGEQQQITLTI